MIRWFRMPGREKLNPKASKMTVRYVQKVEEKVIEKRGGKSDCCQAEFTLATMHFRRALRS